MVRKPGKVLYCTCMFLLAILEVDLAQTLTKHKSWLCVLIQLTNRSTAKSKVIHAWSMSIKQKMCRVKDLPT